MNVALNLQIFRNINTHCGSCRSLCNYNIRPKSQNLEKMAMEKCKAAMGKICLPQNGCSLGSKENLPDATYTWFNDMRIDSPGKNFFQRT